MWERQKVDFALLVLRCWAWATWEPSRGRKWPIPRPQHVHALQDRGADLLDVQDREVGGSVKGGVGPVLEAGKGIGTSEVGQAAIKGLLLYLKQLPELSHMLGNAIIGSLVGSEMCYFHC